MKSCVSQPLPPCPCMKPRSTPWLALLTVASLAVLTSCQEDFYKLLGVSREASTVEIRQTFKKLALSLHPEKRHKIRGAPARLLTLQRAYEVLKDVELRLAYDRYGVKGVEEGGQGDAYDSFTAHLRDCGVYDEDLEVITLGRENFDAAVNSGELWFVNFYSPRCPQCQELAPTWRAFAKELDGVLRIGAVDCGDNSELCNGQTVSSFPSLLLFQAGTDPQSYYGDRSKQSLTAFAMQFVKSSARELRPGNVFTEIQTAFASGIGWLFTFCAPTGDCLSPQTRQKLSGMLEGLVNVGWMDCAVHADLCSSFDVTSATTAYFSPGSSMNKEDSVLFLQSLDAREIYAKVLQQLPGLEALTMGTFQNKLARHRWLVIFSFGLSSMVADELKKLKVLLKDVHMQVGTVDCHSEAELCRSLYIHKPTIAAFKGLGFDNFEIHQGGISLYEIASFARGSTSAHVTALSPVTFPGNIRQPWLVEFFVPKCPTCHALAPELRKASLLLAGQMKFGTVDCTVHEELCNRYGVHSYPTLLIFNQSRTLEYEGHHSADAVQEYVEHLLDPTVVSLKEDDFHEQVVGREVHEAWVVVYCTPWSRPCKTLYPKWRQMARMLMRLVKAGSVDCQRHHIFCQTEGVHDYPEIRLYPRNASRHELYRKYRSSNKDMLSSWVLRSLPRATKDLSPDDLWHHVFSGKDHWLVLFSAPWCDPCQNFTPEFELLGHMLRGSANAGIMDCQAHSQACERAGVKAYPTLRFYPYLGSSERDQAGEQIESREANVIGAAVRLRLQRLSESLQGAASKLKDEL